MIPKPLFSFEDPEDFHRLRDVLEEANYTDAGILEALGVKDFPSIRGDDVPLLLRRTNRRTPLDTLIRLFLISDLLADMAASLGVDLGNITSTFCGVVRRLIERGFLLPAHFGDR